MWSEIVSTPHADSLVTVCSTSNSFEAGLLKAMLADEGIPSFVEDANGPFPGLSAVPCTLMVGSEYETDARRLIDEHEARRLKRVDEEIV